MKVLATAAALRKGSLNRRLIGLAADIARGQGTDVDVAEFSEFDMPLYNADIQDSGGLPEGARELARCITGADAFILGSPEYNYSTPGVLKNAIDWLSRMNPVPLEGRSVLLVSASPALVGGNRGLWATRVPLECVGAWVHPGMFSLAQAGQAFADDGTLNDATLMERLENLIRDYLSAAAALNRR